MLRNRLIAVVLITALMLLIVPLAVSAGVGVAAASVADDKTAPQSAETVGPNLLANPGLEGKYMQQCSLKTDPPWVPAPTPCDPNKYDYANRTLWATAQVPVGWAAWWRVPNRNRNDPNYFNSFPDFCDSTKASTPADCLPWHNPEFRDTKGGPQETGPARRIEGENSQKYFTFYSIHEAGLYQIVADGFKPGDRLRFSAYMMAWSSTENDPFKSVGQDSMGLQVGIDPYGGNNPWSPSIVWSPVHESFDAFSQFVVEAVAQGSLVSVWTRSHPTYAIQHNDVYVDAASLNVVSGVRATASVGGPVSTRPAPTTKVVTTTRVLTRTRGGQIITSTLIVTSTIKLPVTTQRIVTSTSVITSSTGVTSTVITTKTITVPAATPVSPVPTTTRQIITLTRVITSLTGVTSTVIVTNATTAPTPAPSATVTATQPTSGTQLIPASGTYTVARGDTLIAIARRFGITPWWKLAEMNGMQEPYKVEVGMILKLR